MKVLHINRSQEGGAACCVNRIHNALIHQGVESKILVAEGPVSSKVYVAEKDAVESESFFTHQFKRVLRKTPWYFDKEKLDSEFYKKNYSLDKPLYIHHPFSSFTNISHHPLIEWADIVHLHWVPEFIDYPTFFKDVKKPIVWTLHDKFPAEGIQHYCSESYPIPQNLKTLDAVCRKIKRNGMLKANNIHIVAISEQMKQICETSDVLNGFPCTLIHNGVDTEVFKPLDKQKSKIRVLERYSPGFSCMDEPVFFMFSSYWIWEKNKGLQRVIDALEKVERKDKVLLVIGKIDGKIPQANFPIICTGLLSNATELAELYSSADFFIQASLEETFSQTPLESMSCGTPVVSTPCSGSRDLIRPFNGIICNGYQPDDLAEGIKKSISSLYDSIAIRNNIVENFDYSKIVCAYKFLYISVSH